MEEIFSLLQGHEFSTLFVISFLAATILPMGCEPLFLLLITENPQDIGFLIFIATLGNSLGSFTAFALGSLGKHKWIGVSDEQLKRHRHFIERWGTMVGLLGWLPIVGDPLVVLMGLLKFPLVKSVFFITIGKLMRFLFLGKLIQFL